MSEQSRCEILAGQEDPVSLRTAALRAAPPLARGRRARRGFLDSWFQLGWPPRLASLQTASYVVDQVAFFSARLLSLHITFLLTGPRHRCRCGSLILLIRDFMHSTATHLRSRCVMPHTVPLKFRRTIWNEMHVSQCLRDRFAFLYHHLWLR